MIIDALTFVLAVPDILYILYPSRSVSVFALHVRLTSLPFVNAFKSTAAAGGVKSVYVIVIKEGDGSVLAPKSVATALRL